MTYVYGGGHSLQTWDVQRVEIKIAEVVKTQIRRLIPDFK